MTYQSLLAAAIDLNGPGRYLNWSIFQVSVANLVLIAVMVVIFGAALLVPFPGSSEVDPPGAPAEPEPLAGDGDRSAPSTAARGGAAAMWTARVRRAGLRLL